MPRKNSETWNVADPITAERLNKINSDFDDIYSNWNDRLKAWVVSWLNVQIGAWNYRIWSAEGTYAGWILEVTDDETTYIMITSAGVLNISNAGWNTNHLRIAKVIAEDGVITSLENWKPDGVGWVLGGWGFKNITSTNYTNGLLMSFVSDGVTFTLTYNNNLGVKTITNGANTWTATYNLEGNFTWLVES